MTRTDCHRPSAIVPANYEQYVDYDCGGSYPERPFNVDCTQPVPTVNADGTLGPMYRGTHGTGDRCCVRRAEEVARAEGREVVGCAGKCGVCGAHFRYGTMFRHTSGALVHMGHDCASKYEMMYDDSATELERGRHERAIATYVRRQQNDRERAAFLAKHEGLEADLALGVENSSERPRAILADLAAKFTTYRTMSDKQVAFARKLADEIRNPKPAAEQEKHVAAPTGKGVEFEGTIVSAKLREGDWGSAWKVTVKVETEAGTWLAWGTAPSSIMDLAVKIADARDDERRAAYKAAACAAMAAGEDLPASPQRTDRAQDIRAALVGLRVEVKATLERPQARAVDSVETDAMRETIERRNNEDHFVFMSRPQIHAVTWSHPVRNPKVIKAEGDFAKLAHTTKGELYTASNGQRNYYTNAVTDREVVGYLALVKGITRSSMVAAALAPKARKSTRSAEVA